MKRREFPAAEDVDAGVTDIVRAVVCDYKRRAKELKIGQKKADILDRYRAYNGAVDLALAGVEEGLRPILFDDIVRGRGYGSSEAAGLISKNAYYRRRRKVIADTARELMLM